MPAVSRNGDKVSVTMADMQALTTDVFVNSLNVITVDSPVTDGDLMITGSATVFVNGKKVCRVGDADSGGDLAIQGSPNVTCG
jgi:uncharacterized Zn-binding protein involved in type VI secretion